MFRIFTAASFLALTITAAQAEDSLVTRVHDAAERACAAKVGASLPLKIFYSSTTAYCVDRVSADALAKYQANASAKAEQRSTLAQK